MGAHFNGCAKRGHYTFLFVDFVDIVSSGNACIARSYLLERELSAGPMTGHLVARSVSRDKDGKRGELEVQSARRVAGLVVPRKGQAFLKRAREDSLSIVSEQVLVALSAPEIYGEHQPISVLGLNNHLI
jgi:hypothetical protein